MNVVAPCLSRDEKRREQSNYTCEGGGRRRKGGGGWGGWGNKIEEGEREDRLQSDVFQ